MCEYTYGFYLYFHLICIYILLKSNNLQLKTFLDHETMGVEAFISKIGQEIREIWEKIELQIMVTANLHINGFYAKCSKVTATPCLILFSRVQRSWKCKNILCGRECTVPLPDGRTNTSFSLQFYIGCSQSSGGIVVLVRWQWCCEAG